MKNLSQKRNAGSLCRSLQSFVERRQRQPFPMGNLQIGRVVGCKLMPLGEREHLIEGALRGMVKVHLRPKAGNLASVVEQTHPA